MAGIGLGSRALDRALIARLVWWVVLAGCLAPGVSLAIDAATGGLGANPINTGMRALGLWALRFLILGLALTPLRLVPGLSGVTRFKRMIGLTGFAYAVLHLLAYVGLDYYFDWAAIGREIVKRPYITIGMAALVLLIPLAATSTHAAVRRLGPLAWRRLHRLAYVAAPLGVVHYLLLVKRDITTPVIYGLALAAFLGARLWRRYGRSASTARRTRGEVGGVRLENQVLS